jgi:peroxiredoxin
MNNAFVLSSILLWIVVLFNLVLTIALIRRGSNIQPGFDMINIPTLKIGSQAPDFIAETPEGKSMTLADYAGKSVTFIFMSPSCKPCLEKLSKLHELAPNAHRSGVDLILVNTAEKDDTRAFIEKHNIALPVLVAPRNTNPFMSDYKVAGTPFYCVVEKNGKVQSAGYLGSNWHTLTQSWITA